MFSTITEVVAYLQANPQMIGQDYSTADLIADLETIAENEACSSHAALAAKLAARSKSEYDDTAIDELTDLEVVERLRSHVRKRGTPALQNGAWVLMLCAADRLESLILEVEDANFSLPVESLARVFFGMDKEKATDT